MQLALLVLHLLLVMGVLERYLLFLERPQLMLEVVAAVEMVEQLVREMLVVGLMDQIHILSYLLRQLPIWEAVAEVVEVVGQQAAQAAHAALVLSY